MENASARNDKRYGGDTSIYIAFAIAFLLLVGTGALLMRPGGNSSSVTPTPTGQAKRPVQLRLLNPTARPVTVENAEAAVSEMDAEVDTTVSLLDEDISLLDGLSTELNTK